MRVHNFRQRSAEWHALRVGIPTASEFDRIITPQGKRSGQARKYMHQLAYERIVEKPFTRDLSAIAHVQHGITHEDVAAQTFNERTGFSTMAVGFITDDDCTMGCSPDRLIVGRNEAVEIKCPTGPVMAGYLIDGVEEAYKAQLQGQLLIGKFQRVHFFAWHPELPSYHAVVVPDPAFMAMLAKFLEDFEIELARGVAHIRSLGSWPRNTPSVFPDEPDDAA